jgi:hypothetical protein
VITPRPRLAARVKTVSRVVVTTHSHCRCPACFQPVSSAWATGTSRMAAASSATGSANALAVARQRPSTLPTASGAPSKSSQTATTSRRLKR